ncbi:hypothetical protein PAXRUDRAFT_153569 [Paxillus rubicundulus Ve08.2h10]|uniref:Calpain catalytic domain-containing protein n=1 Tax=Paxillus rubicundulus Ve08.2h10 TaxID=930991 RepID=A0A0D0DE26_9AGAM|nr:hypothetical protein PAXRUDRAFT_153569 [Paxillus rubicundulus Ve08.2h10]
MSSNPKTFQEAEARCFVTVTPPPTTLTDPLQTIYDKATKSELASDFTAAFRLYLAAASAFLHLSRSATTTPAFQVRCKANAGKALERAEKIKKASERPGTAIEVGLLPINWFGVDQQSYVLRKSSTVNNIRYPLWTEVVPLSPDPNALYFDPDGQPSIPVSTSPNLHSYEWKRPLRDPFTCSSSRISSHPLKPTDIEQNMVGDCSLCASIAVCVQHNQKFNSEVCYSRLFYYQISVTINLMLNVVVCSPMRSIFVSLLVMA